MLIRKANSMPSWSHSTNLLSTEQLGASLYSIEELANAPFEAGTPQMGRDYLPADSERMARSLAVRNRVLSVTTIFSRI